MKLFFYKASLGIDVLVCIIVVVFFFLGLTDGSVSSFNIGLWTAILGALGLIVAGGFWLKRAGYPGLGTVLLLVLAVPSLCYGLFIILILVTNSRWN